jgi:hypothetical protein
MFDEGLISGSREQKLALLRKRMAAMPERHTPGAARRPGAGVGRIGSAGHAAPAPSGPSMPDPTATAPPWPVHSDLAGLLRGGGLPRGIVGTVAGAGSLTVSLVATITKAGGRVALCGMPGFGFAAALEQDADLDRIAVIGGPIPDPVAVASILLDGADVVFCGLGGISVPPSRSRALAARARSTGAVLLVSGGRWDGAALHLDARVRGYTGLGPRPGQGRVSGIDLLFSARGRGCVHESVKAVAR